MDIVPSLAGLFMLRVFFLLLVFAVNARAQIPMGATKQEVINLIGWPESTSKAGEREILNYPDFTVVLQKNQMESLHFKPSKHVKPLSSYLLPAPKTPPTAPEARQAGTPPATSTPIQSEVHRVATPEEILGPKTDRQDTRPTLSTSTPVVSVIPKPAPPTANRPIPASVDIYGPVKTQFIWIIGLVVAMATLKILVGRSSKRRHRDVGDIFPPPPRKPAGGVPPLVIPPREKPAKPDPIKDGWSLALLKELEWHRFEQVVAAYERELGNDAELTDFGPDGGIDVIVFEKGTRTPKRLIQCKAYSDPVRVNFVRELLGVMVLQKVAGGTFYTTSSYTDEALAIPQTGANLELINGSTFLNRIQTLPLSAQLRLFESATEGDYTTPSCPSCGVKMVTKTFDENPNEEKWVCRNFPRCRQRPMTKKQTN